MSTFGQCSYKSVLLTGGAGFIGSHLAEALLQRGMRLAIIDNLDDFYSPDRKRRNLEEVRASGDFEFIESDICDAQQMAEVFRRFRPDLVVHLAARAGVRPSIEQPALYERVNVAGTLNLLQASRESGVRKFIFGSSSSVYGITNHAPFSDSDRDLRPISPYAATKLAGEQFCYTYAHLYRLPIVALRFFTVYGPRQRPDLAIHKFARLIDSGRPIPVFGDGSSGRDYTYVADIVAGTLAAIDHAPLDDRGTPYDIFNLGNSHPIKLNELIALLETTLGRRAIRDNQPEQPGDVPLTWADISKAQRVLDYRPATPIAEGIANFVTWSRAQSVTVK